MPSISRWIDRLIRWGLGGAFVYAGATKLTAPELFAVTIEAFGLIPESTVMPVSLVLPVLEIIAGAGLIFNLRFSLELIAGLLVLFIAVLMYGIHLGLDIDCGCFGADDPKATAFSGMRTALYRDFLFAAGILWLYCRRCYQALTSTSPMNQESEEEISCET